MNVPMQLLAEFNFSVASRVTHAAIEAHFHRFKLKYNAGTFVRSCLHFICTQTGTVDTRPLVQTLHAIKPIKLLHSDFCYMSRGEDDFKCVFVFKYNHSDNLCFTPTNDSTAEVVAKKTYLTSPKTI